MTSTLRCLSEREQGAACVAREALTGELAHALVLSFPSRPDDLLDLAPHI